jgi:hypothetical protein
MIFALFAYICRTHLLEALMPLQMAFGITVKDVWAVLARQADKVIGYSGMTIDALAAMLYYDFSEVEMDDIALAAMDAFLEEKPEVEGAHRAIRKVLVKRGVLDVSRRVASKSAENLSPAGIDQPSMMAGVSVI